jgi:cellulose biosynthesis protein BcsQ
MPRDTPLGEVITFYSYKGGTGRSMMLANVAWILASQGKQVLVIDWDLEAPGLHRYFAPFLLDPELTATNGVIDFVRNFEMEALTQIPRAATKSAASEVSATMLPEEEADREWYKPLADLSQYTVRLNWRFRDGGLIDFVPSGRQGPSYSVRVSSFDWDNFYERLGGGAFFEAVRKWCMQRYDYILIDSRTGVSDTSGICTVQMPHQVVICFTGNNQSIDGAHGIACSIRAHWETPKNRTRRARRILPLFTRTDVAEKYKLDVAREYVRQRFAQFLWHVESTQHEAYWAEAEVPYIPFYAYEEVLATFARVIARRIRISDQ